MGLIERAAGFFRALDPAKTYSETSNFGFIQAPTSAPPDAEPLFETDQISAVIARCINVISEDAAHVPLRLFDYTGTQPRELLDHPAIDLWRHINPVETPTTYVQQLYADLLTDGNHFAFLELDARGVPISMIRLHPEDVEVLPHPTKIIGGYKWKPTGASSEEIYSPEQVFHVKTRNPASIYRGMGLLPRLREQVILDRSMRAWKLQQYRNGIPTSLIVRVSRFFADEAAWERFRKEFWERLRGLSNAGKPMFVRAGEVDVEALPRPTEQELEWISTLKYTRNEFAMLFGVPPSRLSDYSESFRANAAEQGRTYWQDTIMSWHRLFIDALNCNFLERWYGIRASARQRIAFAYDYSQIRALALSMREMATVNEILVRNALRTPNQAAVSMGDPRHDDPKADQLYMNGQPLGQEPEPILAPAPSSSADGQTSDEESSSSEAEDTEDGEEENGPDGRGLAKLGRVVDVEPPRLRAVPDDLLDPRGEAERLRRAVDAQIREMIRRAAQEEIELAGLLASFNESDPLVLEAVRTQSILVAEEITKTTISEVRKALAENLERGFDPSELRKAIRYKFKELRADWRLDRIARTEAHQAHESGGHLALKQNGVEMKKWISAGDGDVRSDFRSDHVALDGTVVPLDAPFIDPQSRARLMYPGDVSGAVSPADVVNCRCVKVADFSNVLDGRGMFHKKVDPREALSQKEKTRSRFEKSWRLLMARQFKQMEERALAELDRQMGEGGAGDVAVNS